MGVSNDNFEGFFDFKLDAKLRVSVPSEWRPKRGEARTLRLLKWKTYGVPVLKVLTDQAFEAMIRSIDEDEGLNAGQRGQRKGLLFTVNTAVTMNEQGKMPVTKKLADEQGLEPGGLVHLFGRGTNFDIVSPRDHDAMEAAHQNQLEGLYDTLDFS